MISKAFLPPVGKASGLRDVHLAVFLFGFSGLFGKFLLCSPLTIVFGRTVFAALALLPLLPRTGDRGAVAKAPRAVLALQGVLLAVHWCTFFRAIQVSSVAIGLLSFSTFPLFVTFLEPLFFKERLMWKHVLLALVVFAGLVLVVPAFDLAGASTQGALWGVVSGFTFAVLGLVNRKNVMTHSPLVVAFFQNLWAALFLLPWVVGLGLPLPSMKELGLLVILGVVCTALSHFLFIRSLVHIKARTASIATALEPVYGIVLAMVLLGEFPCVRTLIGGLVIVGAALAVTGGNDV